MKPGIALPLIFLLGGCFELFECGNEVLESVSAPSGNLSAVTFDRGCGSTTPFSTQISIVETGRPPLEAGNVFIATGGRQTDGGPWAEARWLSPTRLLVRHDAEARISKAEPQVGTVRVTFEPVSRQEAGSPPDASSMPSQAARMPPARSADGSLCSANEAILFECSVGRKSVAVCGGDLPGGRTYARYLYGLPGKLDMEYPARTGPGHGMLTHASVGYSGGGESQIRFENRGYEYVVYSRTIRTGFGADRLHYPKHEDGLFVRRDGKMVSERQCVDEPQGPVDSSAALKYLKAGTIVHPE